MKSFALLLLGLGLGCLGCRQGSHEQGTPQTRPAAGDPGGKTSAAAVAVVKAGEQRAGVKKAEVKNPTEGPPKVDDRPEVQRLIDNLKDKDWLTRRESAAALGELGNKQAVVPLTASLKDPDNSVRFNAAEALGKLGDTRAVEPLIACLKDHEVDRSYAAEALGKLGDKRAVEPLIACLKDKQADRSYAAGALGKLGDPRAVEPLIACLKDDNPRVRREAAGALGKLGDKRAVEPLIECLPDWSIEDVVGTTLKQLDGKAATDKQRFYCRVAQRDNKGLLEDWKQTRQLILDDAGSQDRRKVQHAIYVVIALGKEDVVDDLVKLLNAHEDKELAEIYLNCRHKGLSSAAEDWAARRGYKAPGGAGRSGPAWGSW